VREITVNLGERSYPICIGTGILDRAAYLTRLIEPSRVLVVTDSTVEKLWLPALMQTLSGSDVITHAIPPGETHKNLETMNRLTGILLENRFDRGSCLIAFGGGVVGDLTGFTAACYQRGIKFLQIPTTLLAQVDSSVGGKTAVNHPLGKNMIGAFHQPCGVVSDTAVLKTLPEREYRSGLAEVVKYGLICDREFYDRLEENMDRLLARDSDELEFAIERSCLNKAGIVSADELEKGRRAILNLGHTFGHAIETGLDYGLWLHGEAVGLGMLMAAHMSVLLGLLPENDRDRIYALTERTGLPVTLPEPLKDTDLRELMSVDKKASHGRLKLILLEGIGQAVITDKFEEAVLQETIEYFRPRG